MRLEQSQQIPQDRLEKIFLSWNDVHSMIKEAHKFILDSTFLPDSIITLHRGGIIPATILSYMLNVPNIHILKVEDNKILYSKDVIDLQHKKVLLVENIMESGTKDAQAIQFLRNFALSGFMTVTLVKKEAEPEYIKPDFASKNVSKDEWVVFPWEALNY